MTSGGAPGSDGFRVSFGLVKEIVAGGPSPEQTRLRELVADRGTPGVVGVGVAPDHPQARAAYVSPSLVVGSVSGGKVRG